MIKFGSKKFHAFSSPVVVRSKLEGSNFKLGILFKKKKKKSKSAFKSGLFDIDLTTTNVLTGCMELLSAVYPNLCKFHIIP